MPSQTKQPEAFNKNRSCRQVDGDDSVRTTLSERVGGTRSVHRRRVMWMEDAVLIGLLSMWVAVTVAWLYLILVKW